MVQVYDPFLWKKWYVTMDEAIEYTMIDTEIKDANTDQHHAVESLSEDIVEVSSESSESESSPDQTPESEEEEPSSDYNP